MTNNWCILFRLTSGLVDPQSDVNLVFASMNITVLGLTNSDVNLKRMHHCTRGIWKVLSMVFYLSNQFTKTIMFGIILKSHLFSMLWHYFHEDIIMQTREILL